MQWICKNESFNYWSSTIQMILFNEVALLSTRATQGNFNRQLGGNQLQDHFGSIMSHFPNIVVRSCPIHMKIGEHLNVNGFSSLRLPGTGCLCKLPRVFDIWVSWRWLDAAVMHHLLHGFPTQSLGMKLPKPRRSQQKATCPCFGNFILFLIGTYM